MMESAGGVLDSRKIMTSSKRIQSMIYGGGEDGDMNVSLGATWTREGPEMMFVRQFSLVSARAAGFDWSFQMGYLPTMFVTRKVFDAIRSYHAI
jgi:citrate lyase subunit beta/citryl-CoA lyase